jgi:8-oxo-dGTP diphosphatase
VSADGAAPSWPRGRLGLTLPLGRTEPNPYALGQEGKWHEHLQAGSGTVMPVVGVGLAYDIAPVTIGLSGIAFVSAYENDEGFRAPSRLYASHRVSVSLLKDVLRPFVGVDLAHETEEYWQGEPGLEGSNVRTELYGSAGLAYRFLDPVDRRPQPARPPRDADARRHLRRADHGRPRRHDVVRDLERARRRAGRRAARGGRRDRVREEGAVTGAGERPRLLVAAAVLIERGRVLLSQRKRGAHLELAWEFPGGKVEPGEDPRAALARELEEELGIACTIGAPMEVTFHAYPEKDVLLLFFEAARTAGSPEPPRARRRGLPLVRGGGAQRRGVSSGRRRGADEGAGGAARGVAVRSARTASGRTAAARRRPAQRRSPP